MNLQEQISRIQSMMGIISEKLEDIQGTPLYHKTSTKTGIKIIDSDSLIGTKPSDEYLKIDKSLANTNKQSAISFTRDKNWKPDQSIGKGSGEAISNSDIIFVVDKAKLQTKYEVEPFNYYGLDPNNTRTSKGGEFEERVLTYRIYPLHKYLIDVIYNGDESEIQEYVDRYKKKLDETNNEESFDKKITCQCGWSWNLSDGGEEPYLCHKCGTDNSKKELTEKCWPGYTQKGMKTMFGKRYPNCVKKTK